MRTQIGRQVLALLNSKPGSWFTQEQAASYCGSTAKNAQAALCKWLASAVVERASKMAVPGHNGAAVIATGGRFVYRVRTRIDPDMARVDNRARVTAKRGATRTTGQLALDEPNVEEVSKKVRAAVEAAIAAGWKAEAFRREAEVHWRQLLATRAWT